MTMYGRFRSTARYIIPEEEEEKEDRSGEKGYAGVSSYMKIKLSPRQLWGEEREKAFLQK